MNSCTPFFQLGTQFLQRLLELSFTRLVLSFEQQGPRAEEKEVWPLALDCCRIFSTVPLTVHTKPGSVVIHVNTPPDMPQEHIHNTCNSSVFRLVICQVTVPPLSTSILPMFFNTGVLRQVKGQYITFAASVKMHEVCLCIYLSGFLTYSQISQMQCLILSPNYEAKQSHALQDKAIVCTPASEISSSTGSYCIRRAAVTTSAKASVPDADAGSICDMRASLAATKL